MVADVLGMSLNRVSIPSRPEPGAPAAPPKSYEVHYSCTMSACAWVYWRRHPAEVLAASPRGLPDADQAVGGAGPDHGTTSWQCPLLTLAPLTVLLRKSVPQVHEGDFFWDKNARQQWPSVAEDQSKQLAEYREAIAEINRTTGAGINPDAVADDMQQVRCPMSPTTWAQLALPRFDGSLMDNWLSMVRWLCLAPQCVRRALPNGCRVLLHSFVCLVCCAANAWMPAIDVVLLFLLCELTHQASSCAVHRQLGKQYYICYHFFSVNDEVLVDNPVAPPARSRRPRGSWRR